MYYLLLNAWECSEDVFMFHMSSSFIPWGICLHEPAVSVHQNFAKGKKYSPSCHQGSDVLLICMYIGLCLYGYVHTHIYSCFHIAQFFLNSSRGAENV